MTDQAHTAMVYTGHSSLDDWPSSHCNGLYWSLENLRAHIPAVPLAVAWAFAACGGARGDGSCTSPAHPEEILLVYWGERGHLAITVSHFFNVLSCQPWGRHERVEMTLEL
jgi:hypothetical protein